MVDQSRFLLGYGERLTAPIGAPPGHPVSPGPYSYEDAKRRLIPMISSASEMAALLPSEACPDDLIVTAITMHPSYVAKSYHPAALLSEAGFERVGSKPVEIVPLLVTKRENNVLKIVAGESPRPTTQLFVASTRAAIRDWGQRIEADDLSNSEASDLLRIESFSLLSPEDRLRVTSDASERIPLEVVLHASGLQYSQLVLRAFDSYARSIGADVLLDRRFDVGSLSFVPVRAEGARLRELAMFTFVRVARRVPRLRELSPPEPIFRSIQGISASLPNEPPLSADLRVAVFDGGFLENTLLSPWTTSYIETGVGKAIPQLALHGHDVTSALLFGSVTSPSRLSTPFAHVDNYQVLDTQSEADPFELFDVIQRIESVLSQKNYAFVNLSIGPALPIEDDDVHAWTAFLDGHLSDGRTLLTTAVGNNGEEDRPSGNARVQVPSDSVNALAVGASDSRGAGWKRASYSALGPGRSPGVVKPDLVAFGGDTFEPFVVVNHDGTLSQTAGTSFAAPLALRTAVGVRAIFGDRVEPLSLKALLIHTADSLGPTPSDEHGWGRVAQSLGEIVTCSDGVARVIYQGELQPGKYLRARLPLPSDQLPGKVTIRATLAFATEVDPADPSNYTRSSVEVVFRPHAGKFKKSSAESALPRPFFSTREFATEGDLRKYAAKWETVLNDQQTMFGTSLLRPVFDLHYNAREEGHPTQTAPKIRYAMVISVYSRNVPDIYDLVLRTYATQLEALTPVLDIPIEIIRV